MFIIKQLIKKTALRVCNAFVPAYKINYNNKGVINFIDVGSVGGLPKPWTSNANHIRFLLNFEPNDSPVKGKNYVTYNTAIWENEEIREFYIYKGFGNTGSSLLKQNVKYVQEHWDELKGSGPEKLASTWFERSELLKTRMLNCRRLDDIISEMFPETPFHFLKIDAQGAEYNILKGATGLLAGHCIGLHLELFTIPLYEGIILLDDVVKFLDGFGFDLIKKYPPHGSFDSQNDCIFIKRSGDLAIKTLINKVYNLQ